MLYVEKLQLEEAYNNVVLISSSTYETKIAVKYDPAAMYPIVPLVDTAAKPNLFNATFIM